jgi:phospholipase C
MAEGLKAIQHVVVLMMENRSFDNLLGWQLGLDPNLFNTGDRGEPLFVWGNEGTDPSTMTVPDPDPGELFTDVNYQLFESYFPPAGAPKTMGGFARNYLHQTVATGKRCDPRAIMHCFHPSQVPVTSTLARSFGVADRWFASAPCQTWPNRFFVHAATADGYVNNTPIEAPWAVIERFPYNMPTVFNQIRERLFQFDKGWRIYFHDMPQSALLSKLWPHLDHFHPFHHFHEDVAKGDLQPYSFLEPRYFPNLEKVALPNDQHPPHNVLVGEQLIAQVYNILRASALWTKTLLIVIWDEHGGCYDHVQPPAAVPPADGRSPKPGQDGFLFNRFGLRVPALLVSPYIPPGVVRPPGDIPFDHTSVIKTVRELLDLDAKALTRRDAVAPSLACALTLGPGDLNLGPPLIESPIFSPTPDEVRAAGEAPLNGHQKALLYGASMLPRRDLALADIPPGKPRGTAARLQQATPGEALPYIQDRLERFLGKDPREV